MANQKILQESEERKKEKIKMTYKSQKRKQLKSRKIRRKIKKNQLEFMQGKKKTDYCDIKK